ncbi:MAG: metallophosphoesterase family protein [Verrucomicrobiales bacterium]|nr:metallophosphoesterase family protein [Verrucomicrobiales bacterium]
MRYAIISDLHANWQAWSAVLADIHENKADAIICLGDVVGYGPRPEEVLTSVRQNTRNFVIGNHDAAACGLLDAAIFNQHAREVVEWTTQQLSPDSINYLRQVPLTLETEDILFVHAEIEYPDRFGYIETEAEAEHHFAYTSANIIFIGHTHKPLAFSQNAEGVKMVNDRDFQLAPGHRYIVNVGSVGEPRDPEDIRARYVLYDSTRRSVYFRRVRFDAEAYRQDLVTTGLKIQPYFLSIIDHEATQGRNPLEFTDNDRMMSVPEKPIYTGNKTAAQKIVVSDTSPVECSPVVKSRRESLMSSLPPAPPPQESEIVYTQSPNPRPQPATQQSNKGFVLFLLGIMLVALVIAILILFA